LRFATVVISREVGVTFCIVLPHPELQATQEIDRPHEHAQLITPAREHALKRSNSPHARVGIVVDNPRSRSYSRSMSGGDLNRVVTLRAARASELAALSELCLRSKAVWGYDRAFMQACRAELTLHDHDLRNSSVQVAERDGAILGVAQVSSEGATAYLEKLFVEPTMMRSGAGRTLFDWAKRTAEIQGAVTLVIEADPDAAAFYRRMGARDDGMASSGSVPGRLLPRLVLDLCA
jgi:N-acetylglutamate synthase-like GNAT family acetyltransferase